MTSEKPGTRFLGGVTLLALAATTVFAKSQNYIFTSHAAGGAVAIQQDLPDYPRGSPLRGQEGWVQLSFVVTADGRAIDPIVINSSGGAGFELEARKVLTTWRFEPLLDGEELPLNYIETRFEIQFGRDAASNKFNRHTNRIMSHLSKGESEKARVQAAESFRVGGWNLYESTILWLMLGRIEGAADDHAGQLEMYRRALAISNVSSLRRKGRRDLLEKIFLLESRLNHYSPALLTLASLKEVRGSREVVERLSARADEIQTMINTDAVIIASATIANPCDCDAGEALWDYIPTRRIFSFANLNGNVERFEARCERQRIDDAVESGKSWTLAPEWGGCHVFVFGDDGATFDFVEHLRSGNESTRQTAVARNYVLDKRN